MKQDELRAAAEKWAANLWFTKRTDEETRQWARNGAQGAFMAGARYGYRAGLEAAIQAFISGWVSKEESGGSTMDCKIAGLEAIRALAGESTHPHQWKLTDDREAEICEKCGEYRLAGERGEG